MSVMRTRIGAFLRGYDGPLARPARRVRRWRQGDLTRHRECLFAALPPRSVGAEIGVHRGDLSIRLLRRLRLRRLYLIDPWEYVPSPEHLGLWHGGQVGRNQHNMDRRYRGVLARFRRQIEVGVIVVWRGYSWQVADRIPDCSLDWAYIDADHAYTAVARDLSVYARKVRPGGILAGDDYGETDGRHAGVTRAVDDFIESTGATVVRLGHDDRQWILRLPRRGAPAACGASGTRSAERSRR